MENKDQGGTERSNEKSLRIKKMTTVEDGSVICEKGWKQTAMCDPDKTRQTSNGSPPRRIKDSICITDPEQRKGEKKNVRKRGSYEQRKENQSRKQYSLRSKAKEQKEESDIGCSAISSMSSRNSTSAMEKNEISVCAKPVSPDMKAPTEQTGNQHGDQAVNNYMGSISDQSINNYMGSIGDQAVNNYMGSSSDQAVNDYMSSVGGQSVNDYKGSIYNQFIMLVAAWEVVEMKQITSIETSVATRVPDHTNVVIMIPKTVTTSSINNMGKRRQIFSIFSLQRFHR